MKILTDSLPNMTQENHNSIMENERPLISVCVPTYNQESEIRQALDGILAQKDVNIEIIIANDGSTDRTHKVCLEYLSKYPTIIKYIKQKKNKGIIKNTEDCLMAATGKYIAICEGDDYWIHDYKLRDQCALMESDEQISMSHTNWINLYQKTNELEEIKWKDANYICEREMGLHSFAEIYLSKYRGIRFSSIVFRSDIFHKIIKQHSYFFNPLFSTIDLGLFLCMAYYGKIAYLDKPTTVYRIHNGSVSVNTNPIKQNRYALGVIDIQAYFANEFNYPQKAVEKRIDSSFAGVLGYSIRNNDIDIAKELWNIKQKYKFTLPLKRYIALQLAKRRFTSKIVGMIIK